MKRLPPKVRAALDETGLPWDLQMGSKHLQVRIEGRLVCILPRGSALTQENSQNAIGVLCAIRRYARERRVS